MRRFAGLVCAGVGIAGSVNGVAGAATTYSSAVVGDLPYGSAELGLFPRKITQINADPDVRMDGHLGDIGTGNCSTARQISWTGCPPSAPSSSPWPDGPWGRSSCP